MSHRFSIDFPFPIEISHKFPMFLAVWTSPVSSPLRATPPNAACLGLRTDPLTTEVLVTAAKNSDAAQASGGNKVGHSRIQQMEVR